MIRALTLALALLVASPCLADELRPLSTDRPDITESPYTVDKGHFQFESDLVRYTRDEGEGEWSIVAVNLKYGVLDDLDVQLVVESVAGVPTEVGHDFGFGDSVLRAKLNLLGNDEGAVAMALMPYVGFPTGGSRGAGAVEGGLIVPVGFELPLDLSGGLMAVGGFVNDEFGDAYHFELLTSQTVSRDLIGGLGAFVEAAELYSSEAGVGYSVLFDGGPNYLVTELFQLDAGVGVGVTEAAPDWFVFTGAAAKF